MRQAASTRGHAGRSVGLVLALWGTLGGCSPDAEVKGNLSRIIGERIQLSLASGDKTFSAGVSLRDARGRTFSAEELDAILTSPKELLITVPPGAAAGPAVLRITQQGTEEAYQIDLSLSRLGFVLTADNRLIAVPLPPTTLQRFELSFDVPIEASLSPDGATLVAIVADELHRYEIRRNNLRLMDGILLRGARAVVARNDGALVATVDKVLVYGFLPNAGTVLQRELAVANVQALAISRDGGLAVALTRCAANDGDCVVPIAVNGAQSAAEPEIRLDSEPTATALAVGSTGREVVVPDSAHVYGLVLDADPPVSSIVGWPPVNGAAAPATPVGVARGKADVLGRGEVDVYGVAESAESRLLIVGFDGDALKPLSRADDTRDDQRTVLNFEPRAIAFGDTESPYLAAASDIFAFDVFDPSSAPRSVARVEGSIIRLLVQP